MPRRCYRKSMSETRSSTSRKNDRWLQTCQKLLCYEQKRISGSFLNHEGMFQGIAPSLFLCWSRTRVGRKWTLSGPCPKSLLIKSSHIEKATLLANMAKHKNVVIWNLVTTWLNAWNKEVIYPSPSTSPLCRLTSRLNTATGNLLPMM